MPTTRLSHSAIGERAYETGEIVECTVANWGWTGQPATVTYVKRPVTRLAQYAIGVANYLPVSVEPINVVTTRADWGWQGLDVTVPAENIYTTTGQWGYTPQRPIVCSHTELGYAYSFNGRVWPTCVFNDFVFGIRAAIDLDLVKKADWGWQPFAAEVFFEDPVEVTTSFGNWGWFGVPVAVPYRYDIQTTVGTWGWTTNSVVVSLPYDLTATQADWGWLPVPVGVSFGVDIGLTTALWGWTTNPVNVEVPRFDVFARWGNWGWMSYPVTVQLTTLMPGDVDVIADQVYQKLLDEGAVQQWLEVWQRKGMDPSNPQLFRNPKNGGDIEVAGITVEQEETPEGDVVQTRR